MIINKYVQRQVSKQAWLVWSLAATFFFFEYVIRVAPGVMASDLMHDLNAGAFVVGLMSALFYYPYVAMQLPVGMLVDRYGAHRLLTVMAFICALSCFIFGGAPNIFVASVGRLLLGFASSFAFVSILKLAVNWFEPNKFPLLAGLTQALGMFGGVSGEAPMSFLVKGVGWRNASYISGAIFLILSVLIGIWVKDSPERRTQAIKRAQPKKPEFRLIEGLMLVLRSKGLWINAATGGFLFASTAAFAELWGVTYLEQAFHMSHHAAATAVMMIFVGWGIGAPLMGIWAGRVNNVRPLLISAASGCGLITLALLYWTSLSGNAVGVMLFCYGLMNSALIIVYARAGDIHPKCLAGTSMAFANMSSVIVGSLLQPIIGRLMDQHWTGQINAEGVRQYTVDAMQHSFWVMPVCFGIAIVLAFYLPKEMAIPHLQTQK